jgi:3-oxoacyl-[acyl-carrier protein] reductase
MINLKDKVALVTGSTGGIGSQTARQLHELGATIIITGTREEKLIELKNELKDRVIVKVANLANTNEAESLVSYCESEFGKLDILVCNAGITRDNLMVRMSDEEFDDVIKVNLKAPFILTRAAMKLMGKNKYGRIIHISSVVGRMGNFGQTNYAAAKAGLIGMVKSAAREGARNSITVNAVAPGFIKTPMTAVIKDEIQDKIKTQIPLGSFGEPQDIASAVAFLASDSARYITGTVLDVNGGMYM